MTLFSSIAAELYQDDTVTSPDLLFKCFEWGHNFLDEYGNNSYNSLKMWEPVMTVYLINFHTYENVNTKGFLDSMRSEFFKSQEQEQSEILENHFTNIITQILQYIAYNPRVLSQLFGLYRIRGASYYLRQRWNKEIERGCDKPAYYQL